MYEETLDTLAAHWLSAHGFQLLLFIFLAIIIVLLISLVNDAYRIVRRLDEGNGQLHSIEKELKDLSYHLRY